MAALFDLVLDLVLILVGIGAGRSHFTAGLLQASHVVRQLQPPAARRSVSDVQPSFGRPRQILCGVSYVALGRGACAAVPKPSRDSRYVSAPRHCAASASACANAETAPWNCR